MPPGTQDAFFDALSAPLGLTPPRLQVVPNVTARREDVASTRAASLPTRSKIGPISALLLHEDEPMASSLAAALAGHEMRITFAASPRAALEAVAHREFDAIILDLPPPEGRDGGVLPAMRQRCDAPIIVIAAGDEQAVQVVSAPGGADDYILKPCSARELLARVRVAIARDRDCRRTNLEQIQVGPLVIHERTRRASVAGKPVVLTSAEFDLLNALAKRPGRALSRERLLRLVRGRDEKAFDRLIDVQVSRLRHKLAAHSETATMIRTVRCVGYMLVDPS